MEYPYFKGLEADRYSFYRVPKALVKADLFQKMSGDAKLLYAVLLDRMSLSIKNGWQDKHGNAYIICTIEEVMDSIHCARQKAVKLLDELEQEFRLIERRRQGLGKPNLLYVKDLYTIARKNMNRKQTGRYDAYNLTYGNRPELFGAGSPTYSGGTTGSIGTGGGAGGSGGFKYDIPSEALSDEKFAKMITEAEKYLGMPYVWGGSSPSTSFDCSGFVCWVINNCGNGWNVGRTTANGLRGKCSYVSPANAQPGDLIFFEKTYNTVGASHVGIYVGNGMMIHCGDPISYTSINSTYWQNHFLGFGRIK